MKINELEFKDHPAGIGGKRATHHFKNGWGVSVIFGGPFYTKNNTYEIAVLKDDEISYDSGLTDDVFGYLSEDEANQVLNDVQSLPIS
ncbi:MAG: hypothetical protein OQK29_01310 [Ignavibacteriaceae bacterium]|nr:hypothetical protein [Ignavibacteriaceae bacterium]